MNLLRFSRETDHPAPARADTEGETAATRAGAAMGGPAASLGAMSAAIRRHRRAVLATLLVVLAATLAADWLMPRSFTARADLWLDHGFDDAPSGQPPANPGTGDPRARNTEIRVVTSNGLLAAVVDKLGLANVRGIGQPQRGARVEQAQARNVAVATVRDNFRIDPTSTSYAVAVRYVAANPQLAAGILNQTLDMYVEERRTGGARGRAQARTRTDVATARDEAMRAQASLDGYRSAATVIIGEDGGSMTVAIDAIDAELRTAQAAERAAIARSGTVRTDAAGVTSPRLAELRAQQHQLRSEQAAPGADPRLAVLSRDIAAEVTRAAGLIEVQRQAKERVTLLQATKARLQNRRGEQAKAAKELARLDAAAVTAQDRYGSLEDRFAAQASAQRTAPGTAYVISHANAAATRSFPDRGLLALGGLLAALVATAGIIALLEALVKGFRSRQHLERKLGIHVIGQVPDLAKTPAADLADDDPMGPADYLFNHPRSTFGTAFRTIHTGLQLGGGAQGRRSIAISSALQTEGKTTVAICLARSAAMAGLRVVLVDCDARRPAASLALSAHVEVGLIDVLSHNVPFREALQRDTPSGAWFLAQSSGRPTLSDAIASDRMAALIAKLCNEFDLVILDTPPTLALAESRALAAMADGVLLVARSRTTPVGAARITHTMLREAGAKVVGATLTFVDA